jgi:hypothetical protein
MKCARTFGVVVAVAAMLTMCRPASATEIIFSFTAAQLEAAIDGDSTFEGGVGKACGPTQSNFAEWCGVTAVVAVPNNLSGLSNLSVGPFIAPSSTGSAVWVAQAQSGGAQFNASITSGPGQYVSFVTQNTGTAGTDYSSLVPETAGDLTGKPPLAQTAVFTIDVFTSSSYSAAISAAAAATWSLAVTGTGFTSATSGIPNAYKNFNDYSITSFTMGDVVAPEPTSGVLFLIGLAVWGVSRFIRKPRMPRV